MYKIKCEYCGNETFEIISGKETAKLNNRSIYQLKCKSCDRVSDLQKLTFVINEIDRKIESIEEILNKFVSIKTQLNNIEGIRKNMNELEATLEELTLVYNGSKTEIQNDIDEIVMLLISNFPNNICYEIKSVDNKKYITLKNHNGINLGKISIFKDNDFIEIWLLLGKKRIPTEEHKYTLKDNKRVIEVILEINNIINFKRE